MMKKHLFCHGDHLGALYKDGMCFVFKQVLARITLTETDALCSALNTRKTKDDTNGLVTVDIGLSNRNILALLMQRLPNLRQECWRTKAWVCLLL